MKKLSSLNNRLATLERLSRGESLSLDEQRAWVLEAGALNDRITWLRKQLSAAQDSLHLEVRRVNDLVKGKAAPR